LLLVVAEGEGGPGSRESAAQLAVVGKTSSRAAFPGAQTSHSPYLSSLSAECRMSRSKSCLCLKYLSRKEVDTSTSRMGKEEGRRKSVAGEKKARMARAHILFCSLAWARSSSACLRNAESISFFFSILCFVSRHCPEQKLFRSVELVLHRSVIVNQKRKNHRHFLSFDCSVIFASKRKNTALLEAGLSETLERFFYSRHLCICLEQVVKMKPAPCLVME